MSPLPSSARLATAFALDPYGLIGQLPIIGRFFPDICLSHSAPFFSNLLFTMMASHVIDVEDADDDADAKAKLKARMENLKGVDLMSNYKVLYTMTSSSSSSSSSADVETQVAGSASLPAYFFFLWLVHILLIKYLQDDKRYADRFLLVRYEDLLANTEAVWTRRVLPFCQLKMRRTDGDERSPLIPRAMQRDSQMNSYLSRETLKQYVDALLPRDIERLDELMNVAEIAPRMADFEKV